MKVGALERASQDRVIRLFRQVLGYRYIGNLGKEINTNIREEDLHRFLSMQGHSAELAEKALLELKRIAYLGVHDDKLYEVNKAVYSALRYGVQLREQVGEQKKTVHFIDWKNIEANDFAVAEEVTVKGEKIKRPDIVLYINGIALGVLELKRSTVDVAEAIRQNNDNQKHLFIKPFFTTIQLVLAGQDIQGLRYAAIDTKEKYYLSWKEINPIYNAEDKYLLELTKEIRAQAAKVESELDKNIIEMLGKERFLELIHDFVVFDKGQKKLCRPNQYFGLKAAQESIRRKEGGIIWHTQGSGKSLTMVWLAKWIREYNPKARVLIITDRTELDTQIEGVFGGVGENIERAKSGADLIEKLNQTTPALLCSLIHKFVGKEEKEEADYANYIEELRKTLPKDFSAKGDLYVFIDECHRTQSGDLNKAMRQILGEKALFIGFTGTPLMSKDKPKSIEIFGKYIHSYKFNEAVKDKVVLDLRYEARDIEQRLKSPQKVDGLFESKTSGLSDYAKAELKRKWGTLKKLFSSKDRLQKIVGDIIYDFSTRTRLSEGSGNAILVCDSIYSACRYYQLFQEAGFKKCAIVTSFALSINNIKGEGEGYTEKIQQYDIYQKMLGGESTEEFEAAVKERFIREPAQMQLLIVVDKLLTGFDAPSATYLYIDKSMRDHNLFQAICRVNRLDGESKEYGYIVDYKDLFGSLEHAYQNFTANAFEGYDAADVAGLLSNRLQKAKEQLDDRLEAIRMLCENIAPPQGSAQYIAYFCGNTQNPDNLKESQPQRLVLYKSVAALLRAYAAIANELEEAGYTTAQAERIRKDVQHFSHVREEILIASGEKIDLKAFEPDMRYLIDAYIGAEESKKISAFDNFGLVELLAKEGKSALDQLPKGIRGSKQAMSEAIENNMRRLIIEESPSNPAYYEKMSLLLAELIELRKTEAIDYETYLQRIEELAKKVSQRENAPQYPSSIYTAAQRALYDNLNANEQLSLALDAAILSDKHDEWQGNPLKERHLKNSILKPILEQYEQSDVLETLFTIIKNQSAYK